MKYSVDQVKSIEIYYSMGFISEEKEADFINFLKSDSLLKEVSLEEVLIILERKFDALGMNGLARVSYKQARQKSPNSSYKYPSCHILRGNQFVLLYLNINTQPRC